MRPSGAAVGSFVSSPQQAPCSLLWNNLRTPHQQLAADSLGNTGAAAAFLFPRNLGPGGPLGILPAALSFARRGEVIFPARRSGGETKAGYQALMTVQVIKGASND
jgi:hypothetical protein